MQDEIIALKKLAEQHKICKLLPYDKTLRAINKVSNSINYTFFDDVKLSWPATLTLHDEHFVRGPGGIVLLVMDDKGKTKLIEYLLVQRASDDDAYVDM
jgi:hypothetical protein